MGITSALVLFAVIWSMTFLIILPIRVKTQGDLGKIVPGTHAGAPEVHNLGKKARLTTLRQYMGASAPSVLRTCSQNGRSSP